MDPVSRDAAGGPLARIAPLRGGGAGMKKLPLISSRPLAKAGLNSERVLMPNKGPGVFEEEVDGIEDALGITTVEKAVAWAQTNSMWPDTFGLACCAIEMMSIVSSRYDISRFGMERFSSSPRQADLLIVSGRVTHKMSAPLRQVYDQMLEPKWVIAMGACASSGGMFNNYTVLQGVDKIVPVDIHVPGCPPRPEALMEGIVRLHEKIMAGIPPAYQLRGVAQ
jgi:NADH-quinone oxidoreductase subunit B